MFAMSVRCVNFVFLFWLLLFLFFFVFSLFSITLNWMINRILLLISACGRECVSGRMGQWYKSKRRCVNKLKIYFIYYSNDYAMAFNNNINVCLFVNKFSTWVCVDMDILKCSRHKCTFFILIAVYGMDFQHYVHARARFSFVFISFSRRENCFIVGPPFFCRLITLKHWNRQYESELNHILYGHNFDIKP